MKNNYDIPFPVLFSQWGRAADSASRTALRDERGNVSYAELQREVDRIALFLRARGLGKGDGVGMMVSDNRRKVAALLGAMQAGCVWIPLDTKQPPERRRSMLADAGAKALLCDASRLEEGRNLLWSCPELATLAALDIDGTHTESFSDDSGELWDFFAVDGRNAIEVSGWKDAWTGKWLPAEIMADYARSVAGRVIATLPKTLHPEAAAVLEVGCGSGLVMRALAPRCGSYHGVDLAPSAVRRAMGEAEEAGIANVTFAALSASRLAELEPASYDAVVFSSVVQAFSGLGYLERVLNTCATLLRPGGTLTLCDVWDTATRSEWEQSLLEYAATRAAADETVTVPGDENLFIPKPFFEQWAVRNGMRAEFTRSDSATWAMKPYVYDVVLSPASPTELAATPNPAKEVFTARDFPDVVESTAWPAPELPSPAYVIFTSGSTGKPKGAACSHANLANLAGTLNRNLYAVLKPEEAAKGFCLGYPFHFDACLVTTVEALGFGHTLHIPSEEALADPALFGEYILAAKPSVVETTPSRGGMILAHIEKMNTDASFIRLFGFGGEVLPPALLERFHALPGAADAWTFNGYGPTECAVSSSMHLMRGDDWRRHPFIPLGEPTDNTRLLLLDDRLKPVPVGLVGEIVVVGAAVGLGYVNAPEETARSFLDLPDPEAPGETVRAYRTGDMARRRRKDGALEFVRRRDGQLKVHGYRLEKNDVTNALLRCAGVVSTAVRFADFRGDGEATMAAYVVMRPTAKFDAGQLREQLLRHLPEYAVPGWFVRVDELPLSPNGKLDESRLPDPMCESGAGAVREPPSGATEKRLAEIWAELLKTGPDTIDAATSFFIQGGYSLLVLRLLNRVDGTFGVHVPVAEFFRRPTIRSLATWLDGARGNGGTAAAWSPLVAARKEGDSAPLCCFHPVGGDILCYNRLAELLPERWPVYMLQSPGLEEGGVPVDTIEGLAELHVDALRKEFGDGPVTLFGWSMGGLTAWEAARLLREHGTQVNGVVLLDMPAENDARERITDLNDPDSLAALFTGVIELDAAAMRGMNAEGRIEYVLELGIRAGLYPADMPLDALRRLFAVYAANGRAAKLYRLVPQAVRVLLVRPRQTNAALPYMPKGGAEDYGWSGYALDGVELRWVGGGHNNILEPPQVGEVVGHVTAFLEATS